jgi:hypothetical protein
MRVRRENSALIARLGNPAIVGRFHRFLFASSDPEFGTLSDRSKSILRWAQLCAAVIPVVFIAFLLTIVS